MANEKRLIDANALEKYFREKVTHLVYNTWNFCILVDHVLHTVRNAPTVDAEEVVRCKDCIHFETNKYTEDGGYCNQFGYYDYAPRMSKNDFCSYGERKDNVE